MSQFERDFDAAFGAKHDFGTVTMADLRVYHGLVRDELLRIRRSQTGTRETVDPRTLVPREKTGESESAGEAGAEPPDPYNVSK